MILATIHPYSGKVLRKYYFENDEQSVYIESVLKEIHMNRLIIIFASVIMRSFLKLVNVFLILQLARTI